MFQTWEIGWEDVKKGMYMGERERERERERRLYKKFTVRQHTSEGVKKKTLLFRVLKLQNPQIVFFFTPPFVALLYWFHILSHQKKTKLL